MADPAAGVTDNLLKAAFRPRGTRLPPSPRIMKRLHAPSILVPLLIAAGCADAPDPEAARIWAERDSAGVTVVDNKLMEWEKGDSFVVPLWSWHRHENRFKEPAILFSINDRPSVEALGFYREEERETA